RSQSALMSSLVQISNNCLKRFIRSASDSRSASSPPPSARTCVTCVSIITASRVCCAVNGIGPYLLALREGSRTTGAYYDTIGGQRRWVHVGRRRGTDAQWAYACGRGPETD